jgi:hypothetical protein
MSNEPEAPPTQQEPTYHVIGADGSTYGPADFATLKEWVKDGRILPSTMLINDQTSVRLQARYVPGLIDPSTEAAAPPHQSQGYAAPVEAPKKTSTGWLIAAVVVIAGCAGCGVVGAAILFPVFAQSKEAARRTAALSNIKQLSTAMIMYASDYDDRYPLAMDSARTFGPVINAYVRNRSMFMSMNPAGGEIMGNKRLSGKPMEKLLYPAETVAIYDSLPWRDNKGLVGYADGHALLRDPYSTVMAQLQRDPFKP